jgi:tetratricopeptide (TPR) repeat protein
MRPARKFSPLLVAILLAPPAIGARHTTQLESDPRQAIFDEFPEEESSIRFMEEKGLTVKLAARALHEAPSDPKTMELLARAGRVQEALRVLEEIVASHPDRIAAALRVATGNRFYLEKGGSDRTDTLLRLSTRIRSQLNELPREMAADIARELITFDVSLSPFSDRDAVRTRLQQAFTREYAGTEAALMAEVFLISDRRASHDQLAQLGSFVRAHDGTIAAAAALFQKGFQLHVNIAITGVEPRGSDPTERFMSVLDVVKELESGKYPKCEWVDRAPQLVWGFYVSRDAKFAPENVDRMLGAYETFFRARFAAARVIHPGSELGYLLISKMAPLFALKGDPLPQIERILDDIESNPRQFAAARYLRGLTYTRNLVDGSRVVDPAVRQRAKQTLSDLAARGTDFYHRAALAAVATLHYADREYGPARDHFKRYLAVYPRSPFAWVAALRVAQSDRFLANREAAVKTYLEAADAYATNSFSVVIHRTQAGETLADLGQFDKAMEQYRAALAAWDDDYGANYRFTAFQIPDGKATERIQPVQEITRHLLRQRIEDLAGSTSVLGRDRLEQGRRALERNEFEEAVQHLTAFTREHAKSAASAEGRRLLNLARWHRALGALDVAGAAGNDRAALDELDALIKEPYDFAVFAATATKAAWALMNKRETEADATMRQAMRDMKVYQQALVRLPATQLEQDVVAITDEVFRPARDGIFAEERAWKFDWSEGRPDYLLAPRNFRVTLANKETTEVRRTTPFPRLDNVLFIEASEIKALVRLLEVLGGTERRAPGSIMEVPNQPIGRAREVTQFWNRFFPVRPGHWMGWELLSYPNITQIEFTNDARTRAIASVTIGYTGATVVLEKVNGAWRAKEVVNFWIT